MKLTLRRCHTCRALGVGPNRVKLWPFEGRLYCGSDYRDVLTWDESRGNIVLALQIEDANVREGVRRLRRTGYLTLPTVIHRTEWRGYICDLCQMAGWALAVGDRRTFVYYFSRAVWAWALKENENP